MRDNWVRQRLLAGRPAIGSFLGLGSPNVAELMARAGMDWLVIETEHNALDSAEIQHMLMALNGSDTVPIVRVPSSERVFIQRALDMGAMGIMVPSVRTADEARAIVSATRYPPDGSRTWGPLRASDYTFDNADYLRRANDNILVCLILETREAVKNLEEIASVPGVDVLSIGPWDLSIDLGLDPLNLPHPEVDQVARKALEVGRKHSVAVGFGASNPDALRERQSQGFTFLAYGPDYALFASAVSAGIDAFQRD